MTVCLLDDVESFGCMSFKYVYLTRIISARSLDDNAIYNYLQLQIMEGIQYPYSLDPGKASLTALYPIPRPAW